MKLKGLGEKLGLFPFLLIVLGVLMVGGGDWLSVSSLTGIGVGVLGLGVMLIGLSNVVTRYAHCSSTEGGPSFTYRGVSAVAYGAFIIFIGAMIVVGGLAWALGQGEQLLDYVLEGPGIVLIWLGLLAMSRGFASLVGAVQEAPRRSFGRFLMSLPGRLSGLLFFVLGIVAVAAGGLKVLDPQMFDQVVSELGLMPPPVPR